MYSLASLKNEIDGDVLTDSLYRGIYATDASVYREIPDAVVRPASMEDIEKIVRFARETKTPLIPRAGGTSLAGQVVGKGLIVDVSKYLNKIIEIDPTEKWVHVEPGVILDELNQELKQFGLFFGPETSTANRCTIGGMVGNNACGAHSLIYGSTRDHLLSVKAILSDGSFVEFADLSESELKAKLELQNLEGKIYRNIVDELFKPKNQENIRDEYPDASINRRNTGYAIDLMLRERPFEPEGKAFNFSRLIAGSEGTLCFITEIKLNLVSVPPDNIGLVCVHLNSLEDALNANLIALKYKPGAVELMDKTILDLTKGNILQLQNRWFIEGDPGAILIVEFARQSKEEIEEIASKMKEEMLQNGFGFAFPLIFNEQTKKVWNLRKAGLGVLSNIPGDAKPVSVIEDTAVKPADLTNYISDFKKMLSKFKLDCVFHAHIGTGELHLRPILNLKKPEDVELFYQLAFESARLTKKYKGSLSGEHGDGRLRGQFIPLMVGDNNYKILQSVKKAWDPDSIFNPGKITGTPPMNQSLRNLPAAKSRLLKTYFDYSEEFGFLRAIEKCNGSGDCRKTEKSGGIMCPSYMATRDEKNTTRGRANALREFMTGNAISQNDAKEALDLCLSCKACKSECPSSVDMAKLKAEFFQHYYQNHVIPLRTRMIAGISGLYRMGSVFPGLTNFFLRNKLTSGILKRGLGFAMKRSLPLLAYKSLHKWIKHNPDALKCKRETKGKVYLFIDEFINFTEPEIGIATIQLLTSLGFEVLVTKHRESGRAYLSKGLLAKGKKIATANVLTLEPIISESTPLIGIEPSAILSFRDEYISLVDNNIKERAKKLSQYCFMVDEFIEREVLKGNIKAEQFSDEKIQIKLHPHCHQRSIASIDPTLKMLKLMIGAQIDVIPSGCCGMAGSFGFEKEHYKISMDVGELVLFPNVRATASDVFIVAPGISCRQQIKDGTGRLVLHPVQIMQKFLK